MNNSDANRTSEKVTGVFFIGATTTAIIGSRLYDPVLQNADLMTAAYQASTQLRSGAFFELLLAFFNIGTGIMLYPRLKRYSESWGLGYALFRLLEVVFILVGVTSMLSIVQLSHDAASLSGHERISLEAIATMLKTVYSWAFILGPHFMLGINTFIYSCIFYRTSLLPRKLAALGMLGAVLIFLAAILELFGLIRPFSATILFFALPIAVYEMVLAGWLLIKGFSRQRDKPVYSTILNVE